MYKWSREFKEIYAIADELSDTEVINILCRTILGEDYHDKYNGRRWDEINCLITRDILKEFDRLKDINMEGIRND